MIESNQFAIRRLWPYVVFAAVVGIYSWLTLGQGFNATDEGYLLSLGQRVLEGEAPYRDFYFLRTPGSIYIQAAMMALFGDSYTVLASRVFWLVEMVLAMVLLSIVYRRHVREWEVLLLLLTTFVVSTLLMAFPWYNYDAVFFGVVTAVFMHRRSFLLAGLAAFLAAMCKQSYVALLPGYVVLGLLVQLRVKSVKLVDAGSAVRLMIGFAAPAVLYAVYLTATSGLGNFYRNVVVFPQKASQTTWAFALFQNHDEALVAALPVIAAVVLWFYLRRLGRVQWGMGGLVASGAVVNLFWSHHRYVYSLMYAGLTVAVLAGIEVVRRRGAAKQEGMQSLLSMLTLGVLLAYLAGFNYAGVILAYSGCGLLVAMGYMLFREVSPSPWARAVATGVVLGLLAAGVWWRYDYVYRDAPRSELESEFRLEKLDGITSTRRNTWQIEQMANAIRNRTEEDDYIFVFPDFPILYYLADRRNPTPIPWYVQVEYGGPMTIAALESLRMHPPRVIFLQTFFEIDHVRDGAYIDYPNIPRFAPFYDFITANYVKETTLGDIHLYVPKAGAGD